MDRALFCIYWLYFLVIRWVTGGERLLDYLAMSLVVIGLIRLISARMLHLRLVLWMTFFLSPLFIANILYPNMDSFIFVIKTYIVAIYFSCYFKVMGITNIEFTCFMVPFVFALIFFIYPEAMLVQSYEERFAGIGDPNQTARALIISLCGSIGVYFLTTRRIVKKMAIIIVLGCSLGTILTASRSGFIGLLIALCLIFVMNKKILYAGVTVVAAIASIITNMNSIITFMSGFALFNRITTMLDSSDTIMRALDERSFMVRAWDHVQNGDWLISGSPTTVGEFTKNVNVYAAHNSLLDIGLAFGKASFYFYVVLFVFLMIVNVRVIALNWRCKNDEEKFNLLTPMLFLSLLPMYMSLSAGLAMDFILWMVLGAYPILHAIPKRSNVY